VIDDRVLDDHGARIGGEPEAQYFLNARAVSVLAEARCQRSGILDPDRRIVAMLGARGTLVASGASVKEEVVSY